jgi:hypothetical protein
MYFCVILLCGSSTGIENLDDSIRNQYMLNSSPDEEDIGFQVMKKIGV